MKTIILLLFTLSLLVSSTIVFAGPGKRTNSSYQCKHIGIPKVQSKKFKKSKKQRFNPNATYKGNYASISSAKF